MDKFYSRHGHEIGHTPHKPAGIVKQSYRFLKSNYRLIIECVKFLLGAKWLERRGYRSEPFRPQVKNAWSFISTGRMSMAAVSL